MDTRPQVRPLTEEAAPAWLSLMNNGLRDCPGFESLVDLDCRRMWGGDKARAGLTLAVERGGELVGAVSLIFGRRRGCLRDLVVRTDARRCGTGTVLVEAALDRFRKQGLRLAEAQDWDAPPYRAFYAALGFHSARRYLLLRWDLTTPLPALPVNTEPKLITQTDQEEKLWHAQSRARTITCREC